MQPFVKSLGWLGKRDNEFLPRLLDSLQIDRRFN
jgi:hypothetical protein